MKLDYISLGVSAPNYPPLNNDTEFHRFNREARFRRNVAVAACVMVLVAVALVILRVM